MTKTIHHALSVVALALSLLVSPAVLAGGTTPEADGWVPVKHLEFTADDVEGGLLGPDGELIEVAPRVQHRSLIEIREGFEAEVVKTMEDM